MPTPQRTKNEDDLVALGAVHSPISPSRLPSRFATPTVLNWAVRGLDSSERAKNVSWSNATHDEAKPLIESLEPGKALDKRNIDNDNVTGEAADSVRLQTPVVLNWSVSGNNAAERSHHATWSDMANDSKPLPNLSTPGTEFQPPEPAPLELVDHHEPTAPRPTAHTSPLSSDRSDESTPGYSLPDVSRTDSGTESAPRKRRRLEPVVELPSLSAVYRRKQVTVKVERESTPFRIEEVDVDPFQQWRNPMVKVKKELELRFPSVNDRLGEAGISSQPYPVDIDLELLNFTVSRKFITHLYGGNTQATFPKIEAAKLAKHGLDDMMFPNTAYNPHVTVLPGAPGLFFAAISQDADPWPKIQRVIVLIRSGVWLYVGQYECTPSRSLTKEEWLSQKPIVRRTWAKQIMIKNWGATIRSRIILRRRLGREPTEQDWDNAEDNDGWKDLTVEEVSDALDQGLEFLAVWCMKCVGYDVDFQRNLAAKYPAWAEEELRKKAAGETGKKSNKPKKGPKSPKKAQKRKRGDSEPSDSGEQEGVETERYDDAGMEEDQEAVELVYRSRGTRSRPIVL